MKDHSEVTPEAVDSIVEDTGLSDGLAELFASDGDIQRHVVDGVQTRLQARSTVGTLTGLVSVGLETIGLFLNNGTDTADRLRRGR